MFQNCNPSSPPEPGELADSPPPADPVINSIVQGIREPGRAFKSHNFPAEGDIIILDGQFNGESVEGGPRRNGGTSAFNERNPETASPVHNQTTFFSKLLKSQQSESEPGGADARQHHVNVTPGGWCERKRVMDQMLDGDVCQNTPVVSRNQRKKKNKQDRFNEAKPFQLPNPEIHKRFSRPSNLTTTWPQWTTRQKVDAIRWLNAFPEQIADESVKAWEMPDERFWPTFINGGWHFPGHGASVKPPKKDNTAPKIPKDAKRVDISNAASVAELQSKKSASLDDRPAANLSETSQAPAKTHLTGNYKLIRICNICGVGLHNIRELYRHLKTAHSIRLWSLGRVPSSE